MEIEDWEATTSKMNALNISLTVVFVFVFSRRPLIANVAFSGVDFDDDDFPFEEENKSEKDVRERRDRLFSVAGSGFAEDMHHVSGLEMGDISSERHRPRRR